MNYKIVRYYYQDSSKRVIKRGLSLEQAQAWCRDPETSSKTCQNMAKIKYTRRVGAWFDGYIEDK
jgi:hypothetical protein